MKHKQRKHTKGTGPNPVDYYPEIDKYIPVAETTAKIRVSRAGDPKKFNRYFMESMDSILAKNGLRVL